MADTHGQITVDLSFDLESLTAIIESVKASGDNAKREVLRVMDEQGIDSLFTFESRIVNGKLTVLANPTALLVSICAPTET